MSSALVFLACLTATLSTLQVGTRAGKMQPEFDHGVDLPTKRPLIVAHRGSSGTLPEHTVEAYKLAVDQGADVIECDVTMTADRVLICMHESWMSATTNVSSVYPASRMRTYYVQDQHRNITDYFTVDFTLRELRAVGKVQRFNFRDPNYDGQFGIATLEDIVAAARRYSRVVGTYLETKDPIFINSILQNDNAGFTFEDLLLKTLGQLNYTKERSPCFLQSFNEDSLKYMADRTTLPVVVLLSNVSDVSNQTLARYASFAYGIGPDKRLLVQVNATNQIAGRSDLVQRAHAFGLRVHPFTLRNEYQYLAWDYGQDPVNEYADFFELGVDGAFTDFPATYYKFLNCAYQASGVTASYLASKATVLIAVLISTLLHL